MYTSIQAPFLSTQFFFFGEHMEHWIPVMWVGLAIVLLLVLTIKYKLHSFLALLIVGMLVAFLEGMPLDSLVSAISKGAGNTLAGVGLIVILGALFRSVNDRLWRLKEGCRRYFKNLWH